MENARKALINSLKQLSTALPSEVTSYSRLETDLGIKSKRTELLIETLKSKHHIVITEKGLKKFHQTSGSKTLLYILLIVGCLCVFSFSLTLFLPALLNLTLSAFLTYFIYKSVFKKLGIQKNELRVQDLLNALDKGILN